MSGEKEGKLRRSRRLQREDRLEDGVESMVLNIENSHLIAMVVAVHSKIRA